jgi:hypothetical protein
MMLLEANKRPVPLFAFPTCCDGNRNITLKNVFRSQIVRHILKTTDRTYTDSVSERSIEEIWTFKTRSRKRIMEKIT